MVAVPYRIPIPSSPPPSPPRCSGQTAAGMTNVAPSFPSSSSLSASALKNTLGSPMQISSPDNAANEANGDSPSQTAATPKLNDFELIRVLGKGCAGRVLLVKHTSSARVHAMKAISKRAVLANDELDHTLAEQDILRHFAAPERRNAFVSRLYYSFCDKENFYLVMEFYPGGDLATQMEIHGILGPLRTRFYTCDIVAGLEALHREGILVRDLKPENILLNWHGHAVLADFGLSKSFGFRGDPIPVKLPPDYIEGKGTPPIYAGKGFGSYRNGELTWDRAYSFVGTQEYLAPEVIKRNHYTYAIDWWALGCIVCECLTGRVPFRGHEDESNAQLYDRVVNAKWDSMYRGSDHPTSYLKDRYRIDTITYDFIDGLLQKEPMFRLTEPSVKSHPYFTNVDWATVAKGDYQDPFQLEIDPVAEYNTQFFPRLCLEETPTVDMSGHDYGKDTEHEQNALNNDEIYASLQEQFSRELETFEWSCQDLFDDQEEDQPMDEDVQDDEPMNQVGDDYVDGPLDERLRSSETEDQHSTVDEPMDDDAMPASPSTDGISVMRDISTPEISRDSSRIRHEASRELERIQTPPESHADLPAELESSVKGQEEAKTPQTTPPLESRAVDPVEELTPKAPSVRSEAVAPKPPSVHQETTPPPVPSKADSLVAKAPSVRSQASSVATSAPLVSSSKPATVTTKPSSIATRPPTSPAARPSSVGTKPSSISATKAASVSSVTKAPSIDGKVAPAPVSPKPPSVVLPPPSDGPTSPLHTMSPTRTGPLPSVEVDAVEEIRAELAISPESSAGQTPRLPSGPPLSGLSVSDMISIPSAHQGSPNLIIRRHRHLPSIDSYPHARLSVDLNGAFGQLGDEDWEQLDADAIPELPNGANESGRASLFARGFGSMLGRKPVATRSRRTSTFRAPSGLRKPPSTEASDTSSDRSPSKTRPPLFASRGIENTRRAFTKIKAFPPASRVPSDTLRVSASASVSPSPVSSIRGMPPPASPASGSRSGSRTVSMRDNQKLSPDDATLRRSSMIAALTPGSKRTSNRSNDIQSLFSRPKARRQRPDRSRSGATSRSSIESSTTDQSTSATPIATVYTSGSGATTPGPVTGPALAAAPTAPRLELNPTPPIAWGQVLGKTD